MTYETQQVQPKKILVVGLVRNCASKIKEDVLRLKSALGGVEQLHWLLIESDSTDTSLISLAELGQEIAHFRHISLGTLRTTMPLRTQRISHCRNEYVKEIRHNAAYKDIDYVVISDFDGLNTHISKSGFDSCWARDDWDMCAANQRGPYYDIWALRHPYWSPNDCWAQYKFMHTYESNTEKNLFKSVYSRMIKIPESSDWIEVDSAFGGLAIYKKKLFDLGEYVGLTETGDEFCEHVHFHSKLKAAGAKIFINPQLINAAYTEHSERLRLRQSVVRKSQALMKQTLLALLGNDGFSMLKNKLKPKQP